MTYFIGEGEIKELTDISKHVDYQYLAPYIPIIQETKIKPILGTELHDELVTQIEDKTLTGLNSTLLQLIHKVHAYYTYARYAIRGNYSSTATGFKKKFSNESENPSSSEISMVHKSILEDAEFWANELIQYLDKNKADYPLYKSSGYCGNRNNSVQNFGMF